jgi:hypothetical protein
MLGRPLFGLRHPGRRALTGIFFEKTRVILSSFYSATTLSYKHHSKTPKKTLSS